MKVKRLLAGLGAVFCVSFFALPVSATTYSSDVDVKFNFNPNITIDIDHDDIEILDLTPGQQKDSNVVNISIGTNNVAGYTVSASTGNTTYNNTDMTHSNGTNKFTSIAEDASEATLSTDNTWGYAVSPEVESWTTFSGLPIYTDTAKEIAKTDGPSTDITKFKIHAKAAADQPAGDYRNVINFTVVANVPPRTFEDVIPSNYCTTNPTACDSETRQVTIQSITGNMCEAVEEIGTQFQVTDSRDHKQYWISKLKDGKCWMTQNLDLDLAHYANDTDATLTHANTDLGWTTNDTSATWNPLNATTSYDSSTTMSGISWTNDVDSPYSADPGEQYVVPSGNANNADQIYYSLAGCMSNGARTEEECSHYHTGNYYNWTAAIATNDSSTSELIGYRNTAPDSICPAGWRLPVGNSSDPASSSTTEFAYLMYQQGITSSISSSSYTLNGFSNIRSNPTYFVRAGDIGNGTVFDYGTHGYYWSSSTSDSLGSYSLNFYGDGAYSTYYFNRYNGSNVRCVARDPQITIADAYERAYTQNHKGMWVKGPNDSVYHEMQPDEELPSGTDTRFAMQDIDLTYNGTSVCSLVNVIGDQYQALDLRDNKLYYISKLQDGHCWMTQNLDLDLSTAKTLTPEDTDISANWTPSTSTNDQFLDCSTSSSCTNSHNNEYAPGSIDPGEYYWNGNLFSSNTDASVQTENPKSGYFDAQGNAHYHIGNYYNFSAAVAMNGTSSYGELQQIDQSICPAGWRLPDASTTSGSIVYLAQQFQDPRMFNEPFYGVPGGYYNQIYTNNQGVVSYEGNKVSMDAYQSYYTLNTTSSDSLSTTNGVVTERTQSRTFHPSGFAAPSVPLSSYPNVPRFLLLSIRCLAR